MRRNPALVVAIGTLLTVLVFMLLTYRRVTFGSVDPWAAVIGFAGLVAALAGLLVAWRRSTENREDALARLADDVGRLRKDVAGDRPGAPVAGEARPE